LIRVIVDHQTTTFKRFVVKARNETAFGYNFGTIDVRYRRIVLTGARDVVRSGMGRSFECRASDS
jgi:hypothetical protein